jgi:type II restriction/modification system DNA methylase subunit YeeA
MTPAEFIKKWKPVALTERAAAHTHFLDLCKLFEHEDPVSADPTGEWFTFEKGATKTGGGEGFADVWKKNFFAWEYKKKKRDLNAAMDQLVRYAAALENPPLQVVCDTERFIVRTAWTNAVPKQYEIELDDLALPEKREILWAVFHDPERLRPKETRAGVTKEAADKFSSIALRLQGRGTSAEVAHFVNQLVFCFFANSVKLLPEGFFPRLLKRAEQRPDHALEYFNALFQAMEHGGEFDLTEIAHFNGGLFDGRRAIQLDEGDVGLLIETVSLDWSLIDPTIFGTLFERFLDPDKRAQIGAHYTDPEKIMMIVEPVILHPLRAEWEAAKAEIDALLSGRQQPPMRAKQRRRMSQVEASEEVRSRYLERLRTLSILDPACGSGNFLYLALQGVKDIENRANLECESLGLPPRANVVGPEILHGIEINPFAAELARTTIWIGDIQWRRRNAIHSEPPPILRKLDAIECRDALMTVKEDASFVEAAWPAVEFIVGNPPFLGSRKMKPELGEPYVMALRKIYENSVPTGADLVCYWFAKSWNAITAGISTGAGLVATNSIGGGASRKVLEPIANENKLVEAWRDEPWVVEGAAVRVAIICFARSPSPTVRLDGKIVECIFADLHAPTSSHSADLTKAQRLAENRNVSFQGVLPRGSLRKKEAKKFELPPATFVLSGDDAREMLRQPQNPNGRKNSDVVVPFLVGDDITGRPLDRFVVDFGFKNEAESSLGHLEKYPP